MRTFFDKWKSFFSGDRGAGVIEKIKDSRRYLIAILLFVILVVILVKCTGPSGGDENTEVDPTEVINAADFVPDKTFKQDEIEELNELIDEYFVAYAAGDLEKLEECAYPMSENEKTYIGIFSQYIENYQNISCYSKSGLSKGAYLVSVYYDMKFYGVTTLAPGLDFFYVQTDADGKLYINNLYSRYNFSRTENELDPNLVAAIIKFEEQEDVLNLMDTVQKKYENAVASDVKLATMISTTIPSAMADWLSAIASQKPSDTQSTEQTSEKPSTEAPATETPSTEKPSTEKPSTEQPSTEKPETPKKTTVCTTANVYVRSEASKDSEAYTKALEGTKFTKIGNEGDWTKVEYNNGTAYIKSEYLTVVEE